MLRPSCACLLVAAALAAASIALLPRTAAAQDCGADEERCVGGCIPLGATCCGETPDGAPIYCEYPNNVCCLAAGICTTADPGCPDGPGPDSCVYANDGSCDEPTYCEEGTDTTDCSGGNCDAGLEPCDAGCMPAGATCCNDGEHYCDDAGVCCPEGCVENGGTCGSGSGDGDGEGNGDGSGDGDRSGAGSDAAEEECGCAAAPPGGGPATPAIALAALAVAAVGAQRRRRSRRRP
jgi:MYXO-CTERM domain-containing protein